MRVLFHITSWYALPCLIARFLNETSVLNGTREHGAVDATLQPEDFVDQRLNGRRVGNVDPARQPPCVRDTRQTVRIYIHRDDRRARFQAGERRRVADA